MRNISCTEFRRQLADAVESRSSVDLPELGEHAAACPNCATAWEDALLLNLAIARWQRDAPPVDLADSVLARLRFDLVLEQVPAAPREQSAAAAMPAAPSSLSAGARSIAPSAAEPTRRAPLWASVALVSGVCAAILLARPGRPQPGREAATNFPSAVRASRAAVSASDAPVQSLLHHAGSASLELAGEAAKAVTAAAVLVPPADQPGKTAAPPANDDGWVEEVRREFAPVQHHIGHALGFLFQAVPAEKAPAT